ncbi:MAG: PDZ domain-containing protein, partial [Phycisphaeraceae bacterium]|nr:PDZ domain-containing protein [Phycisphaeraceae bacterium]
MPHRSAARRMTWLAFTLLLAVQWTANSRAQPEPTPASPASAPTTQPPEPAKAAPTLDPAWISAFKWRSIGPANMGGRIADLAVNEKDPSTYWVATASGGLLKTTNNGHTWEHQFDRQATVSIGDVTVAPSNPDIVWVGTGEANPRNSVSWGDGVYKSIDGGKSWARMGLEKTFQIGRILVHPTNPDIVYVAAMGRCWGENEERGFYRTADGGKSWERILYVDAKTGAIDAAMMPGNPDTILVAMWERQRDIYDSNDPAKKWGPGSGLYRTTDGGKTFAKITAGLAEGQVGRIGLDFWRKDPSHAYLVMESEYAGLGNPNAAYLGLTGENAEAGARITRVVENGPAGTAGLKVGEIIVGADGAPVASYDALLALVRKKQPGDTLRLQVVRETKGVDLELTVGKRPLDLNARPFSTRLGGQVPNVQDEQGPEGARTGGVYKSVDGGATWTRINSLTPRPMYFSKIRVDPSDENWIWVLGISLHVSSDNGKTFRDDGGRGVHADHHAMWIDPANGSHIILGCDGGLYSTYDRGRNWDHHNDTAIGQFYHVALDSRPVYNVYGGLQDNGSWGGPSRSRLGGAINEDWFRIGGGDGFICAVDPNDPDQLYYESQNGGSGWRNLRTGRSGSLRPQPPRGVQYRFNWKTPFVLSAHNPGIYYSAGNYVFRALSATATIKAISPALGRTERGTATALTESPLDSDVLYVGTDDGMMWTTRDGG